MRLARLLQVLDAGWRCGCCWGWRAGCCGGWPSRCCGCCWRWPCAAARAADGAGIRAAAPCQPRRPGTAAAHRRDAARLVGRGASARCASSAGSSPGAGAARPTTCRPTPSGRRGLVLVHGFVCNRGLWNPWLPRLRAAGVPCIAVNLEPVFGSDRRLRAADRAAVQRVTQATGRPPLLVAHSMGGLALRAWLRDARRPTRACTAW